MSVKLGYHGGADWLAWRRAGQAWHGSEHMPQPGHFFLGHHLLGWGHSLGSP